MTKLTLVDLTGRGRNSLIFILTTLLNEYLNFISRIHGHLIAIVHPSNCQALYCELYTVVQIRDNNLKPATILFPQGLFDRER